MKSLFNHTILIILVLLATTLFSSAADNDPLLVSTPPNPTASTNACGPKTLTRTSNPPGATLWFWQTSYSGTSQSNSSSTFDVYSSGTYYIRAYDTKNEVWSAGSGSVTVTVNDYPAAPSTPTSNEYCGYGTLTRGTPPAGVTWYWQGISTNGTSTADASSVFSISTPGTYYLRAYNSAGCWSATSTPGTVTVVPAPAAPPTPLSSGNSCGDVTLSYNGTPPHLTKWCWQTSSSGTSLTEGSYVVSSSGTYYLRSYSLETNCWSASASSISVTVNPIPPAPSTPSAQNNYGCGNATLTRGTPPGGYTWYWQGTSPSGTWTGDASSTYVVTTSGTYYLRTRNDATGCWSPATGIAVTVYPKPAAPPAPLSSGNSCGDVTLSFNGSPGGNTRWYWQSGSGGTSTALGYASSRVVSSSGTYYLRAMDFSNSCWSDGESAVAVTVNPIPAVPSAPSVQNNYGCGNAVLTRSTPPAGITWYWQGTNSSGTSTSDAASTYSASASGTYYLRARNNASGCWSNTSVAIAVVVYPIPAAPPMFAVSSNLCGPKLLTFTGAPTGTVSWYWQTSITGTSFALGSSSTLPVAATATYYLRAYNSNGGCWSPAKQADVTYNAAVGNPTTQNASREEPGSVSLITTYGPGGSPNQFRWYNNAGDANPAFTTSTTTYSPALSATTTWYVSAFNTSTTCESQKVMIKADIYPKPVISSSGTLLKMGDTYTLSASNNTYDTYTWKKDNVTIATTPTVSVNTPGTYSLRVTKSTFTGPGSSEPLVIERALDQVNMNYVIVNSILAEGVSNVSDVDLLTVANRARVVQYLGGFGNNLQTVVSQATPAGKDMVSAVAYDALGRQPKQYMPYVSANDNSQYRPHALSNEGYAGSEQFLFYQQTGNKIETDTKPYSLSEYEASPTGRVLSQTGPGNDWHTNQKKIQQGYGLNLTTDNVRLWKVNASGMPVSAAAYSANELYVATITDEDNNTFKTYTDKLGRVVQKANEVSTGVWLQTSYVYNQLGQIAFVLPPMAIQNMPGGYAPVQAFLDQWAFQYKYDDLGRPIETKTPGKGWTKVVYDILDRPVMSQDPEQSLRSEWSFVKYDAQGRTVATGYKVIGSSTRTSVQASVTAQVNLFELPNTTSVGYTLDRTYPAAVENDLLSVSYYDHYDFLTYTGWDVEAQSFAFVPEMTNTSAFLLTTGLPTGGKVRVIDSTTPSARWLNAVQYYDKYYRPVQMISENHLVGLDRITQKYSFSRLLETLHTHGTSLTVLQKFEYDNAGRLTKIFHNINNAPADQLVAQYEYNELGQQVDKKLHYSGGSFLQSVDYRYTIRGWLRSINGSQLTSGTDNEDSDSQQGDHFGMELLYQKPETGLNELANETFYNGSISAFKWKGPGATAGEEGQQSYKYQYDKSGRLLSATSRVHGGAAGWTTETGALNEVLTYDANGNILTLQRNQRRNTIAGGLPAVDAETIDNLTYTYNSTVGNQLIKVEDAAGKTAGFNNAAVAATEVTYDANGGLKTDLNKGVNATTLNILGKPYEVTFSNGKKIQYTYSASGTKLTMKTYQGTTLLSTTDYLSGMVYENGVLSFMSAPEGRVVKNGSNYEYQYALADHQGNTRVVFSTAAPAPSAAATGLENDPGTFNNFPTGGNRSALPLFNNTPGGTYSNLLNGGNNSQVGVAKSFKVYPGDKVKIQAFGKYESGGSAASAGFATALLAAFNVSAPLPGETGTAGSALNYWGGLVDNGAQSGATAPQAFVNIIVLDKNYNFIDAAWEQISASAEQVGITPVVPHDEMMKEYTVKEAGYVYLYVSNNSPVKTYFDDITVTYTPTNVIQYNEYYPYGLQTSGSWTRDNATNNFLYNAGSELNATTQWYETFFRGYDPVLGRFNQIDPLAGIATDWSPYHYAKNNPVMFNDPMGDRERPPDDRFDAPNICYECVEKWGPQSGGPGTNSGGSSAGNLVMTAGEFLSSAFRSTRGGNWSGGGAYFFSKNDEAYSAGSAYLKYHNAWSSIEGGEAGANSRFSSIYDRHKYKWGSKGGLKTNKYIGRNKGWVAQQGSVLFTNETDAYKYMWNNSFKDGKPWRENFGWITDKGIVVLPTEGYELDPDGNKLHYKVNESDGGSPWYNRVDKGYVYHNNVAYKILASIHTHPNGLFQTPSPGDIDFVAELGTIPHLTIGTTEVWGFKYQGIEGAYLNLSRFNFGTHQQIMSGTSIIKNLGKL